MRLAARFEEVARQIAENPFLGEATRKSRFRRFPIGNYLIVYEVARDEVVVHYVRHGARRRPWEGSSAIQMRPPGEAQSRNSSRIALHRITPHSQTDRRAQVSLVR